jgi:replicative DNA helicase
MQNLNATDAEPLHDPELSILSYAFKCGSINFFTDLDSLSKDHFSKEENASIYSFVCDLYKSENVDTITSEMIYSFAKTNGIPQDKINKKYSPTIELAMGLNVSKDEAKINLKEIKKYFVLKKLNIKIEEAKKKISLASKEENIISLISSVEETITSLIPEIKKENDITNLAQYAISHIKYLSDNPVTLAGIPTGYTRYDQCVGGGYRRGTVNVVGARPKVGKSTFCLNVAKNVALSEVPVLYLDTEMKKEIQAIKWASLCSGISQSIIETGAFGNSERDSLIIQDKIQEMSSKPFYHVSVAGMSQEEIFSICRQWLSKHVGKNANGSTKDCLIILDYLKTMDLGDLGNFQEYQYLGDFITKLHNFAVKHDAPILATVQLNRDGINKDDTSVVSGSDRILWLCSSLAFLKKKTDEDFAAGDSKSNGDRKLIVVETRYGKGMDSSSEYINIISNMDRSEMVEGRFNFEVLDNASTIDSSDELDF